MLECPLNVSQVPSRLLMAASKCTDGHRRKQPFTPKAAAALSMLRQPWSSQRFLYLSSADPAPNHSISLVGSSRAHQIVPQALVVMRTCRVKNTGKWETRVAAHFAPRTRSSHRPSRMETRDEPAELRYKKPLLLLRLLA